MEKERIDGGTGGGEAGGRQGKLARRRGGGHRGGTVIRATILRVELMITR